MATVSIEMNPMALPALRSVLIDRIESLTESFKIHPATSRLTLAEFEALEVDAWPSDLRTVLIEELQLGLAAIEAARTRYIRDGR